MIETNKSKKELIKWFSKINKDSTSDVGEKGANLGELHNNSFPVPNGFVITINSYNYFLEASKLNEKIEKILKEADKNNSEKITSACESIKKLIMTSEFPEDLKEEIIENYEILGTNKLDIEKGDALDILNNANEPIFVSVRNSLPIKTIHKTDGIREQNTYLNIKGNDSLLHHIKGCFASIFNPITIERALKKGNFDKLKIAIIIQKMIESEKSGTIQFDNDSNNLTIKAMWGLGEGLNIKDAKKDIYTLSSDLDILEKQIEKKEWFVVRDSAGTLKLAKASPERQVKSTLNNYEMQRLGDYAQKIQIHLGCAQEIEFAIDESNIYIMQTRKLKIEKEITKNNLEKPEQNTPQKSPDQPELTKEQTEEIHIEKVSEKKEFEIPEIKKVDKITKTKLKLIIKKPEMIIPSLKSGLKKIGLLKIEKITNNPLDYLNKLEEYENLIYEKLKNTNENFEETWIRLSDYKEQNEKNPLLGLHGIRLGLKYPAILKSELKAIKKIVGENEMKILIPQVISTKEVEKVKEYLNELQIKNIKIGVIIETPASVQLIKDFTKIADSISIDLNHLIQYLLAADYKNENTKELYDEMHPALLYQIEYMLRVCKRNNIETNVYGKATENPKMLKYLIQKETTFISIEPEKAKKLSEKIANIENELVIRTDSEPRQYEITKQNEKTPEIKEETKTEKSQEPIIKEETSEEKEKRINQDIDLIEKEKQEYLEKENNEEKEIEKTPEPTIKKETPEEKINQNIDLIEKEKQEYLEKENNEEKEIEKTPEPTIKKETPEEKEEKINQDIDLIEKEKQEYLEKENNKETETEEKKDENIPLETENEKDELIEDNVIAETKNNNEENKKNEPFKIF